jgi:chromate transporter
MGVSLLTMCWEFFKTGLFAVGGGLATLPFLYSMAARYPWFTTEQMSDMIAVSESTPGPMGINMATYAGMTAYGIPGAVLATFSLVLPSLIIIIIIARVLEKFRSSRLVNDAFCGLRPASVGLVAAACAQVLSVALLHTDAAQWTAWFNWKGIGVFVVLMALYLWKKKWHPIVFVALGAVAGIALGM